jgi:hypothetical protein
MKRKASKREFLAPGVSSRGSGGANATVPMTVLRLA